MKDKIYIILLSLLNIIISFLLILQVFLFKNLIDDAVSQNDLTKDIILITIIILSMLLIRFIFIFIRNKYSLNLEVYLKGSIYKSLINKKYTEIEKLHSGKISNIYLTDAKIIEETRAYVIPNIISSISRIIFAFIALIKLNYIIIISLSLIGIITISIASLYSKYLKKLNKEALENDDNLNSYMQESLENIKLIKTLANNDILSNNIDKKLNENYKSKNKRNNIQVFASIFLSSLSLILYTLTICYSAYLISINKITYGTLTALVSLVSYFEAPVSSLASLFSRLIQYKASNERINNILILKNEEESLSLKSFDSIEIKNMSFSYNDSKQIYNNFNYTINNNDIIYIKGESGIGKTTLINILLGFIPYNGEIIITSNNIKYPLNEKTRSLFSYVPQENIIFSGTIKSNFKLFYPNITDTEIIDSLTKVNLYQEINDKGIDYEIYERGKGLSIGQIQRLLIAIALASNKPILIMDEFTSALDSDNENKIVDLITKLNKTIIFVSHRDIQIKNAKILNLGDINDN